MVRSRVIDGTAVAHVQRWTPPDMDAAGTSEEDPPPTERTDLPEADVPTEPPDDELVAPESLRPDGDQLERIREEARQAGFDAGRAEGLRQGEADAIALLETARQIVTDLHEPLAAVDAEVEHELVKLVVAVSRQLIRRELATDHGQIVAAVKEALSLLPENHRDVVLHLNPEDARLVAERLHMDECERTYRLLEDPLIARGGCRLTTSQSTVDATVESRINAAIARVLGDERNQHDA